MRLNFHRRHLEGCTAGHTAYSRSYEVDELRRLQKKCHCPIYVGGTLGGAFRRKNTNAIDWEEAKAIAVGWEQAGAWDVAEAPISLRPPGPLKAETSNPSIMIQFATDAYLANRSGRDLAPSTLGKYKTLVKQLHEFANDKGYVMMEQFQITDIDQFYSRWKDGIRAKGKKARAVKGVLQLLREEEVDQGKSR